MSEPFIAEVRIFACNFAPRNWAFCTGQILPIAQNTALFSLIGTIYGGDGRTTMGLPNLEGSVAMHAGNGPGLSQRRLGERGGSETTTLSQAQLASHGHALNASNGSGEDRKAVGESLARSIGGPLFGPPGGASLVAMASQSLPSFGGNQAHNNMMPYVALNFCIALAGIFPPRS